MYYQAHTKIHVLHGTLVGISKVTVWHSSLSTCTLFCAPTGRAGKGDQSVMNDGAFDGYLKKVESMHGQGKSSFETEFNVRKPSKGTYLY